MTLLPPPLIREHDRLAHQVAADVMRRLQAGPDSVDPMRDALVWVFAHYVELLVERLNRVPELHQLAFFDCLHRPAGPPTPASAALLFSPVIRSGAPPVAPLHTQVAAPAPPGESEPVVFETSADLPLVCARLERAVALGGIPQQAAAVDELAAPSGLARPMLAGAEPAVRAAHIGQAELLGAPGLVRLRVQVEVDPGSAVPAGAALDWGIVAADGAFVVLAPESDGTHGLSHSGELVFSGLPAWPERQVDGVVSRWITCRLRPAGASPAAPPSSPGRITRLRLAGTARIAPTPPQRAFHGVAPLDTSKDFYPLGERPRFGDVMYLESAAFGMPLARVVLDIRLTNPAGAVDAPIPAVSLEGKPSVLWEVHTRRGWIAADADDGTGSLTSNGQVRLSMPQDVTATQVNALEGAWLRMRLVSGNYLAGGAPAEVPVLAVLAPPSIAQLTVGAGIEYGPTPASVVVLEHSFGYSLLDGPAARAFDPFQPPEVRSAALYLGLAALADALAGAVLHLFCDPADAGQRPLLRDQSAPPAPAARWQVRGHDGWRDCLVQDGTDGMRSPGIIELQLGDDVATWPGSTLDPAQRLYWLRVTWDAPGCVSPPELRRLALNVVPALQQLTLEYELLGSGNSRPAQQVRTARAPVIGELVLEVGVPVLPARQAVDFTDGMDQFSMPDTPAGLPPPAIDWETWTRVGDLAGSGSNDRHFMLDPLTGTITFGDGVHGRIPATGANNLRARRYHTGGGVRGNQPAGIISQLRTTIPYVESAINITPAAGGRDADSADTLRRSAAAWLRHRDRAICRDDYAELARQASPEVARAACVASADLEADPLRTAKSAGVVSVVLVPHSEQARPQPARGLLQQVRQYLDARRPLGVDLVLAGPLYAPFDVEAELAVSPGRESSGVAARCDEALRRFLHPLAGGPSGTGWDFGQRPHASDVHPVLDAVDGVDHIRSLLLHTQEDVAGLLASGAFLVCSGVHTVRCGA